MLTIAGVGLISKALLRFGGTKTEVRGLETLLEALKEENRRGRGVITVSNHISILDDPLVWGTLPWRSYFSSRKMRWTMGASEIMFTNSLFSQFFRNGQVIETFRGKGIRQPAVDLAIQKLDQGDWIHVFPEGKVNQCKLHPERGLLRFKWGVAHMILQAKEPPRIVPMYLEGLDDVMPENRRFPRFIPRLWSKKLRITFGDPEGISEEIRDALATSQATAAIDQTTPATLDGLGADPQAQLRITLADILHRAVRKLGDDVTSKPANLP